MAAVAIPHLKFTDDAEEEMLASASVEGQSDDYHPINFVYKTLHDSIRGELAQLSADVQAVECALRSEDVTSRLVRVRNAFQMLVQVNRYHSSVEDEIVYPALEYKVQNVTHSYSVEHGEEDLLLDALQQLLESSINADASTRAAGGVCSELRCKVEEVQVTLQKHLRKEENQLLPLLQKHFSRSEQADLVVQFICCIPVMSVKSVLNWLRKSTTAEEDKSLLHHVSQVVSDPHLRRLIVHWLQPDATVPCQTGSSSGTHPLSVPAASRCPVGGSAEPVGCTAAGAPVPEPLDTLVLLHRGLLHTLEALTQELQSVAACGRVSAAQLHSVAQRWQFLCTVSAFHRVSEDEFVFPIARAFGYEGSADYCAQEHCSEAANLTRLGRLLSELESSTRRNAANIGQLLQQLVDTANEAATAMKTHLAKEEQDVLPVLQKHLTRAEKHAVVWKSLHALPLRLLERIMPWVALHIGSQGLAELIQHPVGEDIIGDTVLVQLLSKWAQRAFAVTVNTSNSASGVLPTLHSVLPLRQVAAGSDPHVPAEKPTPADDSPGPSNCSQHAELAEACNRSPAAQPALAEDCPQSPYSVGAAASAGPHSSSDQHSDPHLAFHISTCAPALVRLACPHNRHIRTDTTANVKRGCTELQGGCTGCAEHSDEDERSSKRQRRAEATHNEQCLEEAVQHEENSQSGSKGPSATKAHSVNPIDHIFQFHRALRREVHQIECHARQLQSVCHDETKSNSEFDLELQRLSGRFLFVQGIYEAHSVSEDEVVFPALEAKQKLRNVSKFYVLDHEHESELFQEVQAIIHELHEAVKQRPGDSTTPQNGDTFKTELFALVGKLRAKCASMRASLETHVRAEEAEIWPLFTEHFTVEEQSALVGTIIGRTGAVVLQALIPWVTDSFSQEETHAMMDSLRGAAKNTRFEQWLELMVPRVAPQPGPKDEPRTADQENVSHCAPVPRMASSSAAGCSRHVTDLGAAASDVQHAASLSAANADDALISDAAAGKSNGQSSEPPVLNGLLRPSTADSSEYRPGWEDIFRMNASQLESAAARSTPHDEHRDSYLAHHLLVSRFLVAQQQRMQNEGTEATEAAAAAQPLIAQGGHSRGVTVERGCSHYRKNCNLIAPCCNKEVACRLCHDEQLTCNEEMDRYKVAEMVCQICGKRQPCAQQCSECKTVMARYYCSVCHLFDDTEGRDIYHCPFCNMCRRGKGLGIDAFHCMRCNACMSLDLFNKHTCREHAMESNCPICHEDLFESSTPVKELPCGHFMHSVCFMQHTQHRYTCPICFKTVGDLTLYFQMLDRLLCNETMPEQLANLTQNIQCNDCGKESTVKYHFVYHKCPDCSSYNTRVV